jgi:hypothetical protein
VSGRIFELIRLRRGEIDFRAAADGRLTLYLSRRTIRRPVGDALFGNDSGKERGLANVELDRSEAGFAPVNLAAPD